MRIVGGKQAAVEPIQQYTWIELDRWKRVYELRSGHDVVGTLRRERFAGWRASVETVEARWTFQRNGLVHQSVVVHSPELELDVATFDDGSLLFSTGRTFRWARGSWIDANGRKLVRTIGDRVRIDPGASRLQELMLLIFLAQYLLVADPDGPAAV